MTSMSASQWNRWCVGHPLGGCMCVCVRYVCHKTTLAYRCRCGWWNWGSMSVITYRIVNVCIYRCTHFRTGTGRGWLVWCGGMEKMDRVAPILHTSAHPHTHIQTRTSETWRIYRFGSFSRFGARQSTHCQPSARCRRNRQIAMLGFHLLCKHSGQLCATQSYRWCVFVVIQQNEQ